MKRIRRLSSILLVVVILSCAISSIIAQADDGSKINAMLERAEEIVNYEWVPSQRIATWNENAYNGKMYFEEGEVVKGMPYSLFTSEIVSDSLLSLSQFKEKASSNYSSTAYCVSTGSTRTGPVYGSCCATFVSEVFGWNFMYGNNPRYDGVSSIRKSPYSQVYYDVPVAKIKQGDALTFKEEHHIIWVGDIDENSITIYEQTPPVARKVTINKATSIDLNGYLNYGGHVYSTVIRSRELNNNQGNDYKINSDYKFPIFSYPLNQGKTLIYDEVNGNAKLNKIYEDDLCKIEEIYDNGWCYVSFPLDAGGSDGGYVQLSEFTNKGSIVSTYTMKSRTNTYSKATLDNSIGYTDAGDEVYVVGYTENAVQIIYPLSAGGYKIGWVSRSAVPVETDKNLVSVSVATLPSKTEYHKGDTVDLSGLKIQLNYDDGSNEIITEGFEVGGFDSTITGSKTITVTYNNKQTTFSIKVLANNTNLTGDVDGDGEVSDWDAILLNRYLAGWNVNINQISGDIDHDGEISDWDAIVLERYLAGWNIELN